jgi:hypothetical protein
MVTKVFLPVITKRADLWLLSIIKSTSMSPILLLSSTAFGLSPIGVLPVIEPLLSFMFLRF